MQIIKRKIPIFWGFLIINFLVIFLSTSYLFLHWKNFSEHISYAYYNESAEEIGRLIADNFNTGQIQARAALTAPSKLLQEFEVLEFVRNKTSYFQNFLTTMLVPNNISRFGIYIPNRGHVVSWTDNFDIYYKIDISGSPNNGVYHYKTGKGWEKTVDHPEKNIDEFIGSTWINELYKHPGTLQSSSPWINVNTGRLGLRTGKYIKTTHNTQGISDIIIYCDCTYVISTDFFDPVIDVEIHNHSNNNELTIPYSTQKHPILIIDKDKNIYLSEDKYIHNMIDTDDHDNSKCPVIRKLKEGFERGELFLPENNNTIYHYDIPQDGYPNSMVVILKIENSKWWIAMVFAGTMIDNYSKRLNTALFWAMTVIIIIYFALYIIIRSIIVKPVNIINDRIAGMKDLVFIRSSYSTPVLELDNIDSSLNTFEASFKSFLKFVPRDMLLKQLSTGKEVTAGWKDKELCVLACQISNFYSISTSNSKFSQQLGIFLEIFDSVVIENNGSLLNPQEMRFLAVWSRDKIKNHLADNAIKSATAIMTKIEKLNKVWHEQNKATFDCNFFIYTNNISIGNIGTENKLHYQIFGEKVYQAMLLMKNVWSENIKLAIDSNTANNLSSDYITRPISIINIADKDITVYEAYNTTEKNVIYADINLFCSSFSLGWKLYYTGEYENSLKVFADLHNKYPHDIHTQKYIKLCSAKLAEQQKGSNKDILGIN